MFRFTYTTSLFNMSSLSDNHSFKSAPESGTGGLDIVLGHLVPLLLDSSLQGVDTVVGTLTSP